MSNVDLKQPVAYLVDAVRAVLLAIRRDGADANAVTRLLRDRTPLLIKGLIQAIGPTRHASQSAVFFFG